MKRRWLKYCSLFIVLSTIIVIIVILVNLLQGKTTITNNEVPVVKYDSLHCISNNIDYPIFTHGNAENRKMNIELIFTKDSLKTIALDYTLYYNNEAAITSSEAHNHAAMNINFSSNGLEADAFNAKYTKLEDSMRMSLYARGAEINNMTAKYFLIKTDGNGEIPASLSEYETNYTKQGLICEIN